MADSVGMNSTTQIQTNYEKYKEYFATETTDSLDQMDFLTLMTEQMKSQDFTNPMDNSEFIAQMAQFNTLQQMQEMVYTSNLSYGASLVGKTVVVGDTVNGEAEFKTGVVSSLRLNGTNFEAVVDGKVYSLSSIMEIKSEATTDDNKEETDKENTGKEDTTTDKVE